MADEQRHVNQLRDRTIADSLHQADEQDLIYAAILTLTKCLTKMEYSRQANGRFMCITKRGRFNVNTSTRTRTRPHCGRRSQQQYSFDMLVTGS